KFIFSSPKQSRQKEQATIHQHHRDPHLLHHHSPTMAPELTYSNSRNKLRRQAHNVRVKGALATEKRDMRLKRKRLEDKQPELRRKRLAENIPNTIERQRVFDEKREGPIITISKPKTDETDEPIDPTQL